MENQIGPVNCFLYLPAELVEFSFNPRNPGAKLDGPRDIWTGCISRTAQKMKVSKYDQIRRKLNGKRDFFVQ